FVFVAGAAGLVLVRVLVAVSRLVDIGDPGGGRLVRQRLPHGDAEGGEQQHGGHGQEPAHPRLAAQGGQPEEVVVGVGAGVGGLGGGGLARAVGLPALDEGVHALPGGGRHRGGFAQDEGEDLVAGGDLGEVDVGLQADLLDLAHLLGVELAVEVLGDVVGVEAVGPGGGRGGQPPAAGDLLDAGDQLLGGGALR